MNKYIVIYAFLVSCTVTVGISLGLKHFFLKCSSHTVKDLFKHTSSLFWVTSAFFNNKQDHFISGDVTFTDVFRDFSNMASRDPDRLKRNFDSKDPDRQTEL